MTHGLEPDAPAIRRPPSVLWAAALGLLGLVERLALWGVYQPVSYGDTPTYLRLAEALSGWTLNGYDGTRVPAYPGFLLLLGKDLHTIWLAQMALGLAISLLLFGMTYQTTRNPRLAFVVGLLYDLIPGQFLFEANILSETLTTFFLISSLAILAWFPSGSKWGQLWMAPLLGVVSGIAGLVRTLFFLLPPWLLPFVGLQARGRWTKRAGMLLLFSVGPVLLLGGWIRFIFNTYGMLSPSTMGGYHMVQHTGVFFELLPDEAAPIRDTYLKYRDAQIAGRGDQTNAIWDAIPELTEVSGLNFFDLSREMQRLSWILIREHPDLYLRNVLEGWVDFWKAPVYWRPELIRWEAARPVMAVWGFLGRGLSLAANTGFLAVTVLWIASRSIRRRFVLDLHLLAASGLIWASSVVQAILDHGDNPRFLVPLQMAVVYVVVRAGWSWYLTRKAR